MTKIKLGFMFDIESLDVGPKSVITQLAFVAYDLDDPQTPVREVNEMLPIQPQLALNRSISADTLIWWMQQDDAARLLIKQNSGNDLDELLALVRSVIRKFEQTALADNVESYEIWARGPQFDIVNIESLITDCGERVPWKYDTVNDLRTLMRLAGLRSADVPRNPLYTPHIAVEDCRYQIDCYVEALRQLRSRSGVKTPPVTPVIPAAPSTAFGVKDPSLPV